MAETLAVALIRQAAGEGARLILTPEATNRLERRSEGRATLLPEAYDPAVQGLSALARELGIWLQVGSVMVKAEEDAAGRAANRALLIAPEGRITARYDKLHVFDVDLDTGESWRESKVVRPASWSSMTIRACARCWSTIWGSTGSRRRAWPRRPRWTVGWNSDRPIWWCWT